MSLSVEKTDLRWADLFCRYKCIIIILCAHYHCSDFLVVIFQLATFLTHPKYYRILTRHVLWTWNIAKVWFISFSSKRNTQQRVKCKIMTRLITNITRPSHYQYNYKENSIKKTSFVEIFFCLFMRLLLLKSYPNTDAKQRKTKK
jgi:hypothetical protein